MYLLEYEVFQLQEALSKWEKLQEPKFMEGFIFRTWRFQAVSSNLFRINFQLKSTWILSEILVCWQGCIFCTRLTFLPGCKIFYSLPLFFRPKGWRKLKNVFSTFYLLFISFIFNYRSNILFQFFPRQREIFFQYY